MSSGTFATAMFSGVLNSHKDMPHYSILTLIACLPCIMWVDQAQCQQLHTNKTYENTNLEKPILVHS